MSLGNHPPGSDQTKWPNYEPLDLSQRYKLTLTHSSTNRRKNSLLAKTSTNPSSGKTPIYNYTVYQLVNPIGYNPSRIKKQRKPLK
jgi:hypothetical protein